MAVKSESLFEMAPSLADHSILAFFGIVPSSASGMLPPDDRIHSEARDFWPGMMETFISAGSGEQAPTAIRKTRQVMMDTLFIALPSLPANVTARPE